ncbi:MAG: NirA family protein [Tepidisphaeraceae bacterium]
MHLPADDGFSEEQKQYLDGFVSGAGVVRSLNVLPTWQKTLGLPEQPRPTESSDTNIAAQDRFIAEGKKLCAEEQAKRKLNGLDTWDLVLEHARDARFPKGTDVFMMKFQGLFYVAPAQDAFMCRLRLPGGFVSTAQFRGVADLAEKFGGGYADVTTRANLQIRQIGPKHTVDLLMGLHELGIVNRGAGADNIRNVTASPTAGVDPQELFDTRPLARQMHHYILNHREMYGLPRKFNIAFDGGGLVSALEDTNDIGFTATLVKEGSIPFVAEVKTGTGTVLSSDVGFRLTLGGITGHKDFARDTGIMLTPEECVPVAAAIVRAFIDYGDRTDRKKARLKYVLDRMGLEAFVADVERRLPSKFRRVPLHACETRPQPLRHGHVGFHAQKQAGLSYVGVVLPVGRMTCEQMRQLAAIADRFGNGTIRLTVWQNLLISDIRDEHVDDVKRAIEEAGLGWSATNVRGGLVACTGSAGCKYAAANTKLHATRIADYLDGRVQLDQPINIHLTGCHHSCAQHYIGDIGLIATKVPAGEDVVEGYHIYVGGGYGSQQGIGREVFHNVAADDAPAVIERALRAYLAERSSPEETFLDFVRRLPTEHLARLCAAEGVTP